MQQKITQLQTEALASISVAKSLAQLDELKIKFLGRKSEFSQILRSLKDLTPEAKKEMGQLANKVKKELEEAFAQAESKLGLGSFDHAEEKIDITIPGQKIRRGHLHPLTKIQNEIEDIFTSMGFVIADGPEVEREFYNFDALNIPQDHPARDKWDTFWLKQEEGKSERALLRTHTSPVQVRFMEKNQPPFRIVAPGRCFRNEATDATHEHTFYQFEALVVGEDINVGNFKYIAQEFFSRFFQREILVRIRPSFFPFTEPSFEFDISCTVCGGSGCSACKGTGWLEVGGAGMVNQEVFVAAGYPRGKYQGFAWGFGLERLLMMRDKINDIRLFQSGDLRFINQF